MIKIEGDVFYVLDARDEKWVFAKEEDAISKLKEVAKGNPDPEQVKILEVDCSEDKWSIKQMSWAKIAMKLLTSV
ncbi:MAG TPA: hypothetical protein EYP68_01220 [Candidatus Korarchaeota archaeon]|nr:hypothetical protein [Candidatus Korarchaeota archaeon]